MKTRALYILLFLLVGEGLTSCKKQLVDKYQQNQNTTTAKTTSEIKAAAGFKWNTTNSLSISSKAVPSDIRVSVLKVIAPDGSTLFQKLQKANQDFSLKLELPAHFDKVDIIYGGSKKSFETKSGKIDLQFN